MKVRDILEVKGSHVHSIDPDQTVLDAVSQLMRYRIGELLVRREGHGPVAGILTERDVLRECQVHHTELSRVRVREAMTRELVTCTPEDSVDRAMSLVTVNRVRHLPVVDGGSVVGMISIGDLVKSCLDEVEDENRYLKEYIRGR